jgi:hypothetical protein
MHACSTCLESLLAYISHVAIPGKFRSAVGATGPAGRLIRLPSAQNLRGVHSSPVDMRPMGVRPEVQRTEESGAALIVSDFLLGFATLLRCQLDALHSAQPISTNPVIMAMTPRTCQNVVIGLDLPDFRGHTVPRVSECSHQVRPRRRCVGPNACPIPSDGSFRKFRLGRLSIWNYP